MTLATFDLIVGTAAERPSAVNVSEALYWARDTNALSASYGGAWIALNPLVAGTTEFVAPVTFDDDITIADAQNISIGTGTGSKIGVAGSKIGFFNATPAAKPTVTGSKGANAALTSLMTALVALGLVADTTS